MSFSEIVQLGTLVAALTAAILGWANFKRSARQKIAEFRVSWLEQFREHCATFTLLATKLALKRKTGASAEEFEPLYREVAYLELLATDSVDEDQVAFRKAIKDVRSKVHDSKISDDDWGKINAEFRRSSIQIMRKEWGRVKSEIRGFGHDP